MEKLIVIHSIKQYEKSLYIIFSKFFKSNNKMYVKLNKFTQPKPTIKIKLKSLENGWMNDGMYLVDIFFIEK